MSDEAERNERVGWPGKLASPEVAHIPTGTRCNNSCTFCMERGAGYPFVYSEAEYREILERQRQALDAVVFTGGEPTLNPLLPRLVALARELGYRKIGLVTNGRALQHEPLCDELLEAGLNAVTLSIHGPNASVHDGIARRRGAFDQAARGLGHLASRRQDRDWSFKLNCTLVKANLHLMAEMRAFADVYGVDQVNFNVPEPRGTADELFESVVPRYAEVMAQADRSELDFHSSRQSLSRVPACAGGVEWVQETWHLAHRDRVDVYQAKDGKIQGPLCEGCAIAGVCDGIWERYLKGYGWAELIPWVAPSERGDRPVRIATHAPCNNHCQHCVDGPAAPSHGTDRHPSRQLREGIILGYRSVELAGGEVLMSDQLPRLVGQARNLGYRDVTIETNGRLLNLGSTLDRLEALSPLGVVVRLNAGDEGTHDAMARVPGAFRQTARGMLQLAKRHLPFTVRLRRTERNAPSIERARQLAMQAGAARFEVVG
ncbi:MAG: radical SAM protein [Deltaproteobacteria bacterium]|nr:radical SAM protein [Deltaproteobacteria bacterium]